MTGPPTPPVTSTIEIKDSARTANVPDAPVATGSAPAEVAGSAPVQAVSLGTPEQATTPFRRVFDLISKLATQGKFKELVEEAEIADLSVRAPTLSVRMPLDVIVGSTFRPFEMTSWIVFW